MLGSLRLVPVEIVRTNSIVKIAGRDVRKTDVVLAIPFRKPLKREDR